MKITYTFDTSDENYDATEHEAVKQAQAMAYALNQILNTFRNWTKYEAFPKMQKTTKLDYVPGSEEYVENLNNFIEKYPNVIADIWEMRDEIINIINEAGIDMDKLGY